MIITNNAHNIPRNSFQGNLINKVKPVKTNVASKLKPLAKDTCSTPLTKCTQRWAMAVFL